MATRTGLASATRQRILDAAHRAFGEAAGPVGLDTIAVAAGVTRVTIYHQFGSRSGLIDALFARIAERGLMDRLVELGAASAPRVAVRDTLRRTCRFWHAERSVLRHLTALAATDPELAELFATRESWRRNQWAVLLDALPANAGPAGIGRAARLDAVVALSSFQMYDRLGALAERPDRAGAALDALLGGLIGSGESG